MVMTSYYIRQNKSMRAQSTNNQAANPLCRQWEDMDRSSALHMRMNALARSLD
ncbi:hypothetical protein PSAB6_640027 [Paraburkholderia sabiae]|nr:hypothetical protein PSAB6_640027 [Paraburkholderia sabiae]